MLRLYMGLVFLWAFLDKVLGLGFATKAGKAWLDGVSPTAGFLKFGVHGPVAEIYHSLAGNMVVDMFFMLGLLGIGLAMTLGAGVKVASVSGAIMIFLIYTGLIPPENHPFLDEHILEIIVFLGLGFVAEDPGSTAGIGKWWKNRPLVQQHKWLE